MRNFIKTFLIAAALLPLALYMASCNSCGRHAGDDFIYSDKPIQNVKPEAKAKTLEVAPKPKPEASKSDETPTASSENASDTLVKPSLRGQGQRIPVYIEGSLAEIFNDSNKYQYAHAERMGIKPIRGLRDAYRTSKPIVYISSCADFDVDTLTHSLPFLVPEAADLLHDIGREFKNRLAKRGAAGMHKIKVTSLLRTPASVKRLRRVNVNATDSSTHQFGTTFDISYTRFPAADSCNTIHDGDLKNLLGEVLLDMRNKGRCLVKYERRTPCFHITVTK